MLSIEQCRGLGVSRFACLLKNVVLVVVDYTGMLIFFTRMFPMSISGYNDLSDNFPHTYTRKFPKIQTYPLDVCR